MTKTREPNERQKNFQDESGATTPEYGILLIIGLTTALSVGMLLRDAVTKRFASSTLSSTQVVHHQNRQPVMRAPNTKYRSATERSGYAQSFLIFLQAVLAMALIVMVLRRDRGDKKAQKPPRTRASLEEQLKHVLLAFRHSSANDNPLEPLVGQIMSVNVATVNVTDRVEDAEHLLNSPLHEAVFVLGLDEHLVGQVTNIGSTRGSIRQVMRNVPLTLTKEMRVTTALRTMLDEGCSVAPVTDGEKLCGVVSNIDVMLALIAMSQLYKETQLRHREMMIEACGSTASWADLTKS